MSYQCSSKPFKLTFESASILINAWQECSGFRLGAQWAQPEQECCCAGMAVFDTMRHIRPDVSTVCVGLAASMGAFLLASGGQVGALHVL